MAATVDATLAVRERDVRDRALREAVAALFAADDADNLLTEWSDKRVDGRWVRIYHCKACWNWAERYKRLIHEPGCPIHALEVAYGIEELYGASA